MSIELLIIELFIKHVNKLSELNKRVNTEATAHRCAVAVLKKTEVAFRRCSSKYVLLNISQYSEENNCVGIYF